MSTLGCFPKTPSLIYLQSLNTLDKVSNVEGHLFDLGRVELLDVTHHTGVLRGDEVDSNTLPSETTATTDTVNVVLAVGGQVVVDDQRDLLNVDTTGKQVSGDQNTGRTGTELLHDNLTLTLLHVTVHSGDSEVTGSELLGKPVDLSAGVAEDDGLSDGNGLVQVAKGVELPVLLLNGDVELLDTFEGKLVLLDENADGLAHELLGNLQDLLGHGGGKKDSLGGGGKKLEDVVDLVLETAGQHLIGLVEDEHLHAVGAESTTLDHVVDTSGGTDDDMDTVLEGLHVVTDVGTADTGVALDVEVVSDSDNDLLDLLSQLTGRGQDQSLALLDGDVDGLEDRDGEGSGLTGTGLSLGDDIVTLEDGENGTLLNGRGTLETCR
ncbi:hypothetical protein G7K_5367-t1 [Saitoella complicata NRRL Y-17804]|uniref:Uncharacterized protein n=1 Tax=Saitoella complicata (strain BCRC 22490 / CBS 7301 / JCM 7358 / NBRC 10748 / NRRL Y-17804) TaxID=698492 RepID=A0A0E9NNI1_SAICN|nr:hypothetical protein G7K_5367-t1 [Saitoella complicata NRRL Y-17804]